MVKTDTTSVLLEFYRVNLEGETQDGNKRKKQHGHGNKAIDDSDSNDEDLSEFGDEHDEEEEIDGCQRKMFDVLPNVSTVSIKD